jgi:hypothetical protein
MEHDFKLILCPNWPPQLYKPINGKRFMSTPKNSSLHYWKFIFLRSLRCRDPKPYDVVTLSLKTPGVKLLLCVYGKINHMNLEWVKKLKWLNHQIRKGTHDTLETYHTWKCEVVEHGKKMVRKFGNKTTTNNVKAYRRNAISIQGIVAFYLIMNMGPISFTKLCNWTKPESMPFLYVSCQLK